MSALVGGQDDEESAGAKVDALMTLMRQVTRTAIGCAGADAGVLASQLGGLLESHALVSERHSPATEDELAKAAGLLSKLPPDRAVAFLLDWLNGGRIPRENDH